METIEIIHKRRSIRKFNSLPISEKDIYTILSAGMTSPSAMNKQPWRFIIITDDNIKKEITKISQYAQMTIQSPVSILVCADTDQAFGEAWVLDCSACIQNMLLAACALDIGSVWTGIAPEQSANFSKLFNLPNNISPHSLIVFGHSEIPFEKRDYFDKSKIHNNKW